MIKRIQETIKKDKIMEKKKVGQVTLEEKNQIQGLFERRNGLQELSKVLTADNNEPI